MQSDAMPQLLDVKAVGKMLNCSTRSVYRMADAGKMPPPLKLGALRRWSASAIQEWIEGGCKSVRNVKGVA